MGCRKSMAGNQGGRATTWHGAVASYRSLRANEISARAWNIAGGSPFFNGKSP
jgi:hypothetical protein